MISRMNNPFPPGSLCQDVGDDAGADGLAPLADRKAQPLVHRDRRDQLRRDRHVVPRHHHLPPRPTISTSSRTFTPPRSHLPVTTVPRPLIVKTSSIGIKNGLSTARFGVGMYVSTASSSLWSAGTPIGDLSPSNAFVAAPVITGILSPGNSYFDNNSRTSSSTRSNSSLSSTLSALFRNTTM